MCLTRLWIFILSTAGVIFVYLVTDVLLPKLKLHFRFRNRCFHLLLSRAHTLTEYRPIIMLSIAVVQRTNSFLQDSIACMDSSRSVHSFFMWSHY